MSAVKVRNVMIGDGIPKICVPLVAADDNEIRLFLEQIVSKKPDMIEFRADMYDKFKDTDCLNNVLSSIRDMIGNTVLLFTIRTKAEGGRALIDVDEYYSLCRCACESGLIDIIDVEAFMQDGLLEDIVEIAHNNGVHVIASSHDFGKTPDEKVIFERLKYMYKKGADIAKLAVMPKCEEDVMTLLSATLKVKREADSVPVITMSMGKMGLISRLAGEIFGSAVTFASAGQTSAPGQLPIEDVRYIMDLLNGDQ